MKALTLDDLLPLEEYAGRRREFFEAHGRYLDRYRRVRIGPRLTLLFENRQTLWFRLHEVLRVARLSEPGRVQQAAGPVQLPLHELGVGETGDAQQLLHAEPERLAVLEDQRDLRADADATVSVEVAGLGGEELRPSADVLLQRQQVVQGERLHGAASVRGHFSGGAITRL